MDARRGTALGGVLLAMVLGVTACSGGGGADDSSGSMAAGGVAAPEPASSVERAGDLSEAAAEHTLVQAKAVIMTAEIWMTSKHPGRVRDQVEQLLAAEGGSIADEQTYHRGRGGRDESTLTLRVPAAAFAATRASLSRLGTVKHTETSSEDVSTQVIDVDQRVQTLEASLERLHKFQRSATDVSDLLRYENDITARTSELQSLRAQQTYLRDQTAMSTITLHLSTPARYVAPPGALDHAGFLAGLASGWHALGAVVVVGLTVLGALLPFLLVAALVGVPLWWAVRALLLPRWRRRRPAPQ